MTRLTKDEYMMEIARAAAKRATCDRGRSGAVIANEGRVVSTGYVGAASGLCHCDEVGHLIRKVTYEDGSVHEHCVRTAHAEGNAIVQAARLIVAGGTIYCKMEPCLRCCVDIINAGITRVVAEYRYHGAALTREWFKQAGVELIVLNDEEASYESR
jgi:dCMP deaminase